MASPLLGSNRVLIRNRTQRENVGITSCCCYANPQPRPSRIQQLNLLNELKRRNVLRVGAAYVVAGWLVIQVVETIFPAFGFGDAALRLVTIVLAIGFMPAIVFAWAFELTPEGLKKERDIDRAQSITPQTGKTLDRIIMVVLALGLGYFAIDKFVLSDSREAAIAQTAHQEGRSAALVESYGDQSIAVLPFIDMSPQGDQEYFSDGISEELLNLLAKIPELRVISRSSAFSYKGKDFKLTDVARDLNVTNILEGSIRKAGNQVRITAQLIEARSDTHLWSETYDRPLDNVFAVQDEIAAVVVEQLKIKLLGDVPKAKKTDFTAYELFLRARHLRRQGSAGSLGQSQQLLEQVLEIDANYLPATDDLISVYINQAHTGERPFAEGYETARELTLKGLEIDPGFARLYIHMGWIEAFYDGNMGAAARYYERALSLDSTNTTSLGDTATFLYLLGRIDEAIALGQYINTRDPFHPVGFSNQGEILLIAGRYVEAISSFRKTLSLSPEYTGAKFSLSLALLAAGDPDAALTEVTTEPSDGYRLAGLAIIQFALGNKPASDEALHELIVDYSDDWSMTIAQIMAFRGEKDAAFEWIDKAIEQGHPGVADMHVSYLFTNLYDEPRWVTLMEELGKSVAQLAAIEFEVHLPE